MARRFLENTLHTGPIAYLHARGLVELDFPVLVRPVEDRYLYVVAQWPVEDEAGLFYRVWEPTRAMRWTARAIFDTWYTGQPEPMTDDQAIWDAVRRIHRVASFTPRDWMRKGRQVIGRVSQAMSEQYGERVPPVSLAPVAELFRAWEALVFPHHMTASFSAATLLLMLGVPRERVAVLGVYYQDPTYYYKRNSDWRAGFMSGTPYFTLVGVYVENRWVPVDFTLLASGAHFRIPPHPHPHIRSADLGSHPETGAPLVIDFAHPHTMVFAPTPPTGYVDSPLLARIPLLEVPRDNHF